MEKPAVGGGCLSVCRPSNAVAFGVDVNCWGPFGETNALVELRNWGAQTNGRDHHFFMEVK